jgi:hypothetical protein
MSRKRAKTLLRHYIGYAFELGGKRLDADSDTELEELVDCIVDAAKEEIKKEHTSPAKATIPVQVQCPSCEKVMLADEKYIRCTNPLCVLELIEFERPTLRLQPGRQTEEMHLRLEAFFGDGINLRSFLRESYIAADAVSVGRLQHLIGKDGFKKERYDEVLAKAGEEGWSLCVIGDDDDV